MAAGRTGRGGAARRLRAILLLLPLLSFTLAAAGCMSLEHLIDEDQKLKMYGGTKASYEYIDDEAAPFWGTLWRIIDLPLTVVLDTVLLPVSAPVELSRG
jgi:uncharacterized protein YceK